MTELVNFGFVEYCLIQTEWFCGIFPDTDRVSGVYSSLYTLCTRYYNSSHIALDTSLMMESISIRENKQCGTVCIAWFRLVPAGFRVTS